MEKSKKKRRTYFDVTRIRGLRIGVKKVYLREHGQWLWSAFVNGREASWIATAKTRKALTNFIISNKEEIADQWYDDNNYGLAFHVCGYSGKYQQEFLQHWHELGVYTF